MKLFKISIQSMFNSTTQTIEIECLYLLSSRQANDLLTLDVFKEFNGEHNISGRYVNVVSFERIK